MITATGNNFGAGTIQLKDYQNSNMVILNGRIALDPTDEAYIAAQQLEIYVPDLMLLKSTMTAVFQHGLSWSRPMVTALKSWIKDKNTIVVEKPLVLLSVDVPFFFNAYSYSEDGSYEVPINITGDLLSCTGVSGLNWSQNGVMETRVFIIK